jgi:hypothetical protein
MGLSFVSRFLVAAFLTVCGCTSLMANDLLIIDDRRTGDYRSPLGTSWRLITDQVMGGISNGQLTLDTIDDRDCLRLRGDVRLENRGGFVQAALDIKHTDASDYQGILLEISGNNEGYNLHLRTDDVWLPWQAYRASFQAPAGWHTVRLPFTEFAGYRIRSPLHLERLERIGIVAIGRTFKADLCVASLALYRDDP